MKLKIALVFLSLSIISLLLLRLSYNNMVIYMGIKTAQAIVTTVTVLGVLSVISIILLIVFSKRKVSITPNYDNFDLIDNRISEYFSTNDITPFFSDIFLSLRGSLGRIKIKKEKIESRILQRFGNKGLAYEQYHSETTTFLNCLFVLANEFIDMMELVDEKHYESSIATLRSSKDFDRLTKTESIFKQYRDFAKEVQKRFSDAELLLDEHVLEIAKLNEKGLISLSSSFENLSRLTKNTRLYQK